MRGRDSVRRWVTGLALSVCAALLAGCGTTLFTHEKASLEEPGDAPSDGHYTLYARLNPSPVKGPIPLKKGDRLGFKTAETGRIIAVAGDNEWTFEDAPLIWKRKE